VLGNPEIGVGAGQQPFKAARQAIRIRVAMPFL
jgi:hypothetical protein